MSDYATRIYGDRVATPRTRKLYSYRDATKWQKFLHRLDCINKRDFDSSSAGKRMAQYLRKTKKKRQKIEKQLAISKPDPPRAISTVEIWGKYRLRRMIFFGMKSMPKTGFFTDAGFDRCITKLYFEEFETKSDEGMGTAEQKEDIQAMLLAPEASNFYFNEITKIHHLKQAEKKMTFSTIDWHVLGNFLDGANLGVNNPKNAAGVKCFKNLKIFPSGAITALARLDVTIWNRGQHNIPTIKVMLHTVQMSTGGVFSAGLSQLAPYALGWREKFVDTALQMARAYGIQVPTPVITVLRRLQAQGVADANTVPSTSEPAPSADPEDLTVDILHAERQHGEAVIVQTEHGSREIVGGSGASISANTR